MRAFIPTGSLKVFGIAILTAMFLMSLSAMADTVDPVSDTVTWEDATSGSVQVFESNEVVEVCSFCIFSDLQPWDLYLTEPDGSGIVSDHLYGRDDNMFFASGPAGGTDASIGQACPAANECAVESTTGPTDLTGLYNALGVSGIGDIPLLEVESIDTTATPEPGYFGFLGLALPAVFFAARRKQAQAQAK
jgi:hypothetical protein